MSVCACMYTAIKTYVYIFPVFQIKFEHFSFGLTVKGNQNVSKRRSHGGCPQGPPRPATKPSPSPPPQGHGKSRTTYSTAEPQHLHFVKQKVNAGAGRGLSVCVRVCVRVGVCVCVWVWGGGHALLERLGHGLGGRWGALLHHVIPAEWREAV